MSFVSEALRGLKKAELQTIHQFWLPGESVRYRADELRERVAAALVKGSGIEERVARLSNSQRRLITAVLSKPKPRAALPELQETLVQSGASRIEVESTLRQLIERGFISRQSKRGGRRSEILEIPEELATHLARVMLVEGDDISAADVISQKRLSFDIDFESKTMESRIDELGSPILAELCNLALQKRGILDLSSDEIIEFIEEKGASEEDFAAWRVVLEEAGIGTIGSVSLQDFGITIPDPSLVIFQEWIQLRSRMRMKVDAAPDKLLEAGVDLFIDLEALALHVEQHPVRLTRSGNFPKRLAEQLRQTMALERLAEHLDGNTITRVLRVALRLGIIENFAGELRVNDDRLNSWRGLDYDRKVEVLLQKFLDESAGNRWSFHQEALRAILLESLRSHGGDGWISLDVLIDFTVSTYLLELEEREVSSLLRQRREEDFARERLQSPFSRLGTDLAYWIVNRLLSLGMCEIGLVDGSLSAFRLTALGRELLGHDSDPGECRILVNPDFEIMLITEGVPGMRLELQLARFAERVSAERVRRYRATPESMRSGIRSGLNIDEIRKILEDASDHPLPETVAVSIRDWGRDMNWVQVRPAMIFSGLRPDRCASLCALLTSEKIKHREIGRGEVLVAGVACDGGSEQTPGFIEKLREDGWLVRIEKDDALRLKSPSEDPS
ncbi:MAG: helicase-associated domain-containing protein [Planctomycetota bacterium]|nr:helicase-associated domain-containing protein [Planctomycetota bacterium]